VHFALQRLFGGALFFSRSLSSSAMISLSWLILSKSNVSDTTRRVVAQFIFLRLLSLFIVHEHPQIKPFFAITDAWSVLD